MRTARLPIFTATSFPSGIRNFDYTHPVDGSNPATEWHGPMRSRTRSRCANPSSGWIQNTNNWPFSAAGAASPKRENYPVYMWIKGENPRGIHAVEVLQNIQGVTLDSLIAAGYDPHLTAFDVLLPPLFQDYDQLAADDPRRVALQEANRDVAPLGSAHRSGLGADRARHFLGPGDARAQGPRGARRRRTGLRLPGRSFDLSGERLDGLAAAVAKLQRDFGRWQTPWGDINRYQRLTDDIVQPFDDDKPSLPVGFASSNWGALASFDSPYPRKTKKIYGSVGNSFVAAVEFGPTVRAKAIMSGGESGDPKSPHFSDQALMFTQGKFRDVYFSKDDLQGHDIERADRP